MITNKWTPCSVGLPEDSETVLITHISGDLEFGCRYSDKWFWLCESGTNYWEEMDDSEVLAWMELPLPYKTLGMMNQEEAYKEELYD